MTPTAAKDPALFYAEHGWYHSAEILPDGLLDKVGDLVERLDPHDRDGEIPSRLRRFLKWDPEGERSPRLNQYIALQYRSVAELALHPVIGEIAAQLAGCDEIRLFNSSLIVKEPGDQGQFAQVGWHCDKAYWPTCSSHRMITAWIPLQDTTAEMGTLTVLDCSHEWPDRPDVAALRRCRSFISTDHDELRRRLESLGLPFKPTPMQLRRGQVSFHHPLIFHGSGVNRADRARIALSVHLQDGENHYEAGADEDGQPASYVHDAFVRRTPRGEPDYSDPAICPVVWRRDHKSC
jgi:hypothetical protein